MHTITRSTTDELRRICPKACPIHIFTQVSCGFPVAVGNISANDPEGQKNREKGKTGAPARKELDPAKDPRSVETALGTHQSLTSHDEANPMYEVQFKILTTYNRAQPGAAEDLVTPTPLASWAVEDEGKYDLP